MNNLKQTKHETLSIYLAETFSGYKWKNISSGHKWYYRFKAMDIINAERKKVASLQS